jgi:import receptor subunit TOM20
MSGRFLALCALGLAGSLFVGYCVYFDSKRRSDPDYKKKVLARRRKAKAQSKMIDLRDPKVREEFLIGEMTAANQKMMEGGCGQPLVSCGTCRAPDPLTEKRVP